MSFRCVALSVLFAVTLVGASLPASAGGWGCGCGGPGYYGAPVYLAPPFAETDPGIIYAARFFYGPPPPVVFAPSYAYGPPPRPWRYYPRRYY